MKDIAVISSFRIVAVMTVSDRLPMLTLDKSRNAARLPTPEIIRDGRVYVSMRRWLQQGMSEGKSENVSYQFVLVLSGL